ncbi:Asp-tRNA(Asn)/Glu-tRNA(Gln) amidotransferase subunit GatB [Ekhidna sp.]|uniref:Asp-tRNA(Asn)/Glu-tRNA(Gln) amidotransferase subunit GatB n=1 Tax=Ekhidna sp. TaxID=2608089 RepID=UPI003296D433
MEKSLPNEFQLVVGLEVHIQLSTVSKLFAADSAAYGLPPNTNVSVITLAHPGVLPKLNKQAVEYAIRMGLACNSAISRYCIFDRKNYFYPDLPKGFQTTQDRTPICIGGKIRIQTKSGGERVVELNRIHLEEDAGKSIHDLDANDSFIDLNRAGVPLIELVTEPCIYSADEAMAFLTEIRHTVKFLDICDGNMEQGSLRCDANISVNRRGDKELGQKVEVKNMNSIRNVGRAINHEFKRQVDLLQRDEQIISETRLFDANKGTTSGMRMKEELNDYRYFPEPDLSPFTVSDEWLEEIRSKMPLTPKELRDRFRKVYKLSDYDIGVLTSDKSMAIYFEEVCKRTIYYKQAANWICGAIKSIINNETDGEMSVSATQLADLINAIESGKINHSAASKHVLPFLVKNHTDSVSEAIEKLNLNQSGEEDISNVILEVLNAFPDKVKAYQNGKKNLIGLFMGEVMKRTKGSTDPKKMNDLLRDALEKRELKNR